MLDAGIIQLFEIEVQIVDHLPQAGQRLARTRSRLHGGAMSRPLAAESLANKFSDGEVRLNCAKKTEQSAGYSVRTGLGFKSHLDHQRVSTNRHPAAVLKPRSSLRRTVQETGFWRTFSYRFYRRIQRAKANAKANSRGI
jgi:hypothetical protein